MSNATSVKVSGLDELDAAFRGLENKEGKKIVRAALRRGAKEIQVEAKSRAPVLTGKLKKSIRVKAARAKRKSVLAVRVTTNASDNLFVGDQFYGGFIEFGYLKVPVTRYPFGGFRSAPRGTEPRTPIPGKHFMRDAGEAAAARAVSRFRYEAQTRIQEMVSGYTPKKR